MKFTFDSVTLAQQLSAAGRALNSKNAMPILDCFLLRVEADGQVLGITASDAENTLHLTCPLASFTPDGGDEPRHFCVRAKLIIDALKGIPSQPVKLTVDIQTMEIRGEYANGHFGLMCERADEYPTPPAMAADGDMLTLPASRLLSEIEGTQFAVSDDDLRPVMMGIFFDLTPELMTCVGTDGRALVRRRTIADDVKLPKRAASFILPKKTAAILRGLLAKADGAVNLTFTGTHLFVHAADFDLHARLIDGRYPNYNSVIPMDNPYTANVNTADMMPALRRVLTFADRNSTLVRLALTADALKLKASDVDYAISGEETVPATFDGPANFAIGAKGSILIDVLAHLPKDITIGLSEPGRAMIFSPAEQDHNTAILMLVMPMMLND